MDIGRTVVTAQGLRRWAVVLGLVLVLAAVPVVVNVWPVRAAGVDPADLRSRIAASGIQAHQGYAQSAGLLGLPALPNLTQVTALVSGTTEMRTWYAAPDRWRVDVLGEGTEHGLYQTPEAQFTWDFGDNQLTRIEGAQPVRLPRAADLTPPALARQVLSAAAGDSLTPLDAKRVAGVEAAGMRLTPAGTDTTVAHVDIWADPEHGLPLQVEVTARGGARPVFVTRFLEIRFGAPDAGVLTPPAPRPGIGYSVAEAPDALSALNRGQPAPLPATLAGLPRRDAVAGVSAAGVYGAGLASFVVLALPGRSGGRAFRQITTYGLEVPVPDGNEAAVIETGLLNVLAVRNRNRTFLVAGLVGPDLLRRVATGLAGVTG
ncbi:hypothetical protein [Actinoplanes palleronii]|uniref:MucB/RseB N-terminal domain-containing protein n=1 Tax=Actinoplanes palleronii TaxID=113570 RepID=A0ABQ4BQ77_9ACTN|nr:hypothetical protein [Actinoplanes palleronii]GIE72816.1 hypothetical protein Apa02nite_089240 [Actinoplanes palleronii]